MSTVAAIIDAATEPSTDVPALLRKVKVVAVRINAQDLSSWVDHELSGYSLEQDLPRYRGPFPGQVMGHFSGPMGSEAKIPIPSQRIVAVRPEAKALFKVSFLQPIAEIAENATSDGNLQSPWPADVVATLNGWIQSGKLELLPMHGLVSAWRIITSAQLKAVLDSVVTRILNLALDLEKLLPDGDAANANTLPDAATVSTVVYNHIWGSGNTIALAAGDVQQNVSAIKAGDLEKLLATVASLGVPDTEVRELRDAIQDDAANGDGTQPGSRVKAFMGRIALGAASTSGKISIGAAGGTIANLIKAYYHLG